ncbi:hypothetical protein [Paenibacillus aestuarii]|uniref:DUF2007 domain-containing protein n=1 Tax=Paenibacillus aestuarii TaxID=516965 RepID=A0ABW0KCT7_9BACL|nr:hypothetical protein [Paenibacillus aestuarii]
MVLGMMLLVVALLWVGLLIRSKRWKVLLTATRANSEQVETMYAYFQSHKIRCKLITDVGPVGSSSFIHATDMMPNDSGAVMMLKVHQRDMDAAKKLMGIHQGIL